MEEQVSLFGGGESSPVRRAPSKPKRTRTGKVKTIESRFIDFDAKYPEVYEELRRLAIQLRGEGRKRIGIGEIYEVARYNLRTTAKDDEGFKLNNDFRSRYSRKLIAEIPQLAPCFEMRATRSK
jgi:hypothetical protein